MRKAKVDYYTKQCYTLKSDTKKLWQLINNIINKTNVRSVINYITVDINDYLNKMKVNRNSMYLQPITPSEIRRFIDKLLSKNSSGYDGISNKFLKGITFAIISSTNKNTDQFLYSSLSPDYWKKCMYKCLYNFINKSNIFYSRQYGFRSNHSCEQAIQDLCGHLISHKKDGLKSVAIFLDLSKAFDTLST